MNAPTLVLLVCLAIIAMLIVLLYISTRDRLPACELRRTLDQVRASTRTIEKTLQQQRTEVPTQKRSERRAKLLGEIIPGVTTLFEKRTSEFVNGFGE